MYIDLEIDGFHLRSNTAQQSLLFSWGDLSYSVCSEGPVPIELLAGQPNTMLLYCFSSIAVVKLVKFKNFLWLYVEFSDIDTR